MYQIRFPLREPQTSMDELAALPRSLAVFEGSTSKRRKRREREREEKVKGREDEVEGGI